jgi:PAS domain S-box-containing protein
MIDYRMNERAIAANREIVRTRNTLTGREVSFGKEEVIVSKTDLKGLITYANDVFVRISGFSEEELIGAPHSILRHPDMPRCVFKFLWETINSGNEIFAYVLNRARNGDHYWVFAHVTPSFDGTGKLIGYHSNRRCPDPSAIAKIAPIYASLVKIERDAGSRDDGLAKSYAALIDFVKASGLEYNELALGL